MPLKCVLANLFTYLILSATYQMGLGGFLCFRTKTLQADERARWCENPPKMEVESQAGGQYLNQQTGIMRYERF